MYFALSKTYGRDTSYYTLFIYLSLKVDTIPGDGDIKGYLDLGVIKIG